MVSALAAYKKKKAVGLEIAVCAGPHWVTYSFLKEEMSENLKMSPNIMNGWFPKSGTEKQQVVTAGTAKYPVRLCDLVMAAKKKH